MVKCILHIGTEKTGSTAIQNCLYNQRAKLTPKGFAVSDHLGRPTNRKLVAYFQSQLDDYFKDRGLSTPEMRDAHFDGFIDELTAEVAALEKSGYHTLIITSEHFHSRLREPEDIARLKKFLDTAFSSVRILCYLREQSAVRRGLYSTSVRNGLKTRLNGFQPKIAPGNHYYDYQLFLDKWADVFGQDVMEFALFNRREMPSEDIRRDFLMRIGFEGYDQIQLYNTRVNESLTLAQVAACRAINRAHERYTSDGTLSQVRISMREAMLKRDALKVGKISDTLAPEIYNRFDAANAEIGKRYLGIDGNPFARPKVVDGELDEAAQSALNDLVGRELSALVEALRSDGMDEADLRLLEHEISEGQFL